MRALWYSTDEALASLWRRRQPAALAVATIAVAVIVLGALLVVTRNSAELVRRWESTAELSVFLNDDADAVVRGELERALQASGLVASVEYVTKAEALARFQRDFSELASVAGGLDQNPFPASLEVRLRSAAHASEGLNQLAQKVAGMGGVSEVRYDRRWLERLTGLLTLVRGLGALIVAMLGIGAALTIIGVVRLATVARRHEIEIMQLVGAPSAYIRGPFVMEGVIEGGCGAAVAVATLWMIFTYLRAEYGPTVARVLGLADLGFLSLSLCAMLLLSGMAVGCVGGLVGAAGATPREDR